MAKPGFTYLIIAIILFLSGYIYGDIPDEERAALIALYNSTNGDNWVNNDGWKTPPLHTDGFAMPGTEGTWYGIAVSGNQVIGIALYSNKLTGIIPAELGNLVNLQRLNINWNKLSGGIPAELGNLANLTYISLAFNQLSGSIPVELGSLANLQHLYLDRNQLSGGIPVELGNLVNLSVLNLTSNQLSGGIPAELGNLANLEYLRLYSNQLSGSIPAELGNLADLSFLDLELNQLSGGIPVELGNLVNLWDLKLASNQLSGGIPVELGNLHNLVYLRLSSNQLSGSIPAELGNLVNLSWLALGSNQFSGGIPVELGNLVNLNGLRLDSNRLTGNIPPGLGNLNNLVNLYLNNNYLIGAIPTNLKNLAKLSSPDVDIGYNCLYTNDAELRVWLDSVDPDWEAHQSECDTGPIEPSPPFGEFSTPLDNTTVSSSIPVTGWALGDTGIESVKIYREEGKNLVYIGDGVLVEGARPDVEAAYPGYPLNTKAGWGYMMLTNFLPGGGNGIFKIHAIATDNDGQTTTLGIKTITVDNANAVKPFGAIDTPTQGGTASGSNFINWGWALTPLPNSIPTDGSTINVWVDGINLGNPAYNIYRPDIAALFPGYANSNGSAGYFYLDTTAYENGVHTIQWTAIDNAGNTDGIGSRYFTIENTGGGASQRSLVNGKMSLVTDHWSLVDEELSSISIDYSKPVKVRKGYNEGLELKEIYPDDQGVINIEIRELERVEFRFEGTMGLAPLSTYTGFLVIDDCLRPLPIGSTLDTKRGIFSWQPGPGFYGTYEFVFIKADGSEMSKIRVRIKILPKHSCPSEEWQINIDRRSTNDVMFTK